MIAIQKPPNFPITNVHHRHPSAPPAVVVQPTRIPGLLSLSKPQQRQQKPRQTQKPKQSPPQKQQQQSAVPVQPAVTALKPAVEINKTASPQRGRQSNKAKDKQTRSTSHSSVRSRRPVNRQPSPPTFPSSQAEVPSTPRKSNPFDPFSNQLTFVRAAPKLTARPSGKLAKRRQSNNVSIVPLELPPAPKSIPVPKRNSSSVPFDPFFSDLSLNSKIGKPARSSEAFPICDDMTDAGFSDHEDFSPPTPSPARVKRYDDGPRTAPLTTSTVAFPFNSSPSPLSRKGGRKHKRTPSEGVFTMSSDEEHLSSDSNPSSEELRVLFGLKPRTRATSLVPKEEELERQAAAALAAAYFASSTFQNSPSPDELPPPSF